MRNLIRKILKESEDDFGWTDEIVDSQKYREPMLLDEVDRIMFHEPIDITSDEFLSVIRVIERSWRKNSFLLTQLSGRRLDRMDRIMSDWFRISDESIMSARASYIMLNHRNKTAIVIGPKLQDEMLSIKLRGTNGNWNGNFWSDEFLNRFYKKHTT